MLISLTDIAVRSLKFQGKQTRVMDTNLRGFGLLVSKATKTWIVIKGTERRLVTLGRYPEVSLKDARTRAVLEMGSASKPAKKTFLEACSAFERALEGNVKPDTLKQYMAYLNAMDFKCPVEDITYTEVTEKLTLWKGKPYAQNYAYASIRNLFNFCLEHGYIDKHPLFRKKLPNKTRSRDRVLSDEELARVWRCTENNTYGCLMRLMILTGQRRVEVRNIKPTDIQDGVITFHTKGDKTNLIPITPRIATELLNIPFKFNDWSRSKARFDTECGVDFRHHDLRRSFATKLAQCGVSVTVIEQLLGHTLGGVAGIYNRYSFLDEKRQALLTYHAYLTKITTARA